MKRNAIVRIVCYSILTLVLLGILLGALGLGRFAFQWELDSSGSELTGTLSTDASRIRNIEIEWVSGSIDIRVATDGSQDIRVWETGAEKESQRAVWEIQKNTLIIRHSKPTVGFGSHSVPDKDLTVVFPAGWQCEELELDSAAADIQISDLTVNTLDIDGASNHISVTGAVDTLDCDGASCQLTMVCTQRPSSIDLDGASCSLDLTLPHNCGFLLQLDGLSCKFRSDLDYAATNGDYSYGDQHTRINVDGLSCEVTIRESDVCAHIWDKGTVSTVPGGSAEEIVYTCTLCGVEKSEPLPEDPAFSLSCANEFTESLLLNTLSDTYTAGDIITLRTDILSDVDLHLYVNDEFICAQTEAFAADGSNHWVFTFVMPAADTVICLQTYAGEGMETTLSDLYMNAVSLAAEGQFAHAAGIFGRLGDYQDARERSADLWAKTRSNTTILVHGALLAGIRSDGSLICQSHTGNPFPEIETWTNTCSLAAGQQHFTALRCDGTVLATGDNTYGQCDVASWTDIVSIACGSWFTVGLKADGSVLFAGPAETDCANVTGWTDIALLEAAGDTVLGLKYDGTVQSLGESLGEIPSYDEVIDIHLHPRCATILQSNGSIDVIGSSNYVTDQIIPGLVTAETDGYYLFGTMEDGTPYFNSHGEIIDKGHIVAVVDQGAQYYGLRSDGVLVLIDIYAGTGVTMPAWSDLMVPKQHYRFDSDYSAAQALLSQGKMAEAAIAFGKLGDYADAREQSFSLWHELFPIETISAHSPYLAAVRNDGSVITGGAIGDSTYPQQKAEQWLNIISVSCSLNHILGIQEDGTVVAAGDNTKGECEVDTWQNIILVRAGNGFSLGLKTNGTVVCAGAAPEGIHLWTDVIALECADDHVIGLRIDGTVLSAGKDQWGECNVSDVTNVLDIYTDDVRTTLLCSDGRIINRGQGNSLEMDVYPGLISYGVCAECHYGTMADGSVVCLFSADTVNVDGWQDSVVLFGYCGRLFGLQENGSLLVLYEFSEATGPIPDWIDLKS